MTEQKIQRHQKLLFGYLAIYALLHVAAIVFFFGVERGWGGFTYLWLFWLHVPMMLIATAFAFLAKKTQNSWVWLITFVLMTLSSSWWLYAGTQEEFTKVYLYPIVLILVPLFVTFQLFRLARAGEKDNPKV